MIQKTRISFFAFAVAGALFATSCSPKDSNVTAQANTTYVDNDYETEPQEWRGPGDYYGVYYEDEAAYRGWVRRSWRRGVYRRGRRSGRRQYRRGGGDHRGGARRGGGGARRGGGGRGRR